MERQAAQIRRIFPELTQYLGDGLRTKRLFLEEVSG